MTDDDIIKAAANDPLVIQAHTRPDGKGNLVPPAPGLLLESARTELAAEIANLISQEDISRALLEREYSLDLTSGSNSITQGVWYEVPDGKGQIIAVTIGDDRDEVELYTSRHEFNRWWNTWQLTDNTSDEAAVVIPWDHTINGKPTLLFSPGIGSDTTAYLLHRQRVQSFTSTLFDPEDHHVILTGLKNRLSGGKLDSAYQASVANLKRRIYPGIKRPTPMRRPKSVEDLAWKLSRIYGTGEELSSRRWRSLS